MKEKSMTDIETACDPSRQYFAKEAAVRASVHKILDPFSEDLSCDVAWSISEKDGNVRFSLMLRNGAQGRAVGTGKTLNDAVLAAVAKMRHG
jgi:hypothetical protein